MSSIRQIQGALHQSLPTDKFIATVAGDNSFQSQITGAISASLTGNPAHWNELHNHVGREFYKKLDQYNITFANADEVGADFRPKTVSGLYEAP